MWAFTTSMYIPASKTRLHENHLYTLATTKLDVVKGIEHLTTTKLNFFMEHWHRTPMAIGQQIFTSLSLAPFIQR